MLIFHCFLHVYQRVSIYIYIYIYLGHGHPAIRDSLCIDKAQAVVRILGTPQQDGPLSATTTVTPPRLSEDCTL